MSKVNIFKFDGCKILSDGENFYLYDRREPYEFPYVKISKKKAEEYFKNNIADTETDDNYFVHDPKSGMYINRREDLAFINAQPVINLFQIKHPVYLSVKKIKENEFGLNAKGYVIRKHTDNGSRYNGKKSFTLNQDEFAVYSNLLNAKIAARSLRYRVDILEVQIVDKIYKEIKFVGNF